MHIRIAALPLLLLIAALGCSKPANKSANTAANTAANSAAAPAKTAPAPKDTPRIKSVLGAGKVSLGAPPEHVASAIGALKKGLKQRLMGAMKSGGPSAALQACHHDAPDITAKAQANGVSLGRTSHRLRNPKNAPPKWAAELVAKAADKRLDKVPGRMTLDLGDGRKGYLEMIAMAGACVPCHGPSDDMDDGVKAKLAALYPDDKATGFSPGDVRGWFWAEYSARR